MILKIISLKTAFNLFRKPAFQAVIVFCLFTVPLQSQTLGNRGSGICNPEFPSFEYRRSRVPSSQKGNIDCGMKWLNRVELPQLFPPSRASTFSYPQPADGKKFLGMFVSAEGTWTALSQRLDNAIVFGKCYSMSMHLAGAEQPVPVVKPYILETGEMASAIIRIWLGDETCSRVQLVAVSPFIQHTEWRKYAYLFQSESNFDRITIEAYYGLNTYYDGLVFLDRLGPFMEIACRE